MRDFGTVSGQNNSRARSAQEGVRRTIFLNTGLHTFTSHLATAVPSGAGRWDYLQRQQPHAFQRFIGVHFNFLRSGKNFQVFDVLASQVRALVRQTDRDALTLRTKKRAFFWGASGLTLMVLAVLNSGKRGKFSAA